MKAAYRLLLCVFTILAIAQLGAAQFPASPLDSLMRTRGMNPSSLSPQARNPLGRSANLPGAAQASISASLGRNNREYHAVASGGAGFDAVTPPQKLTTHFGADAVEVSSGSLRWTMALQSYGYGESLVAAGTAVPTSSLNRVEYRRPALTEWYVNGPAGLEQGFTLSEPPAKANGKPLTIALALSGNLSAELDPSRSRLTLRNAQQQAELKYSGLTARDADGKQLHAWLELGDDQLRLKIEDAGARYPVVVDPWVQLAKLTASDGVGNDELGFSIAISGDTVVAGLFGVNRAYVFQKSVSGWADMTQVAELTPSDLTSAAGFGYSIATDGTTVAVAAPSALVGNQAIGAVYIFVEPAGGWTNETETAKLGSFLNSGVYELALSNDILVFSSAYNNGKSFVFAKPAGGWVSSNKATAMLVNPVYNSGSNFCGMCIGVGVNSIALGVPGNYSSEGTVYIWTKPVGGWRGTLSPTATLVASDGAFNDWLGLSVAVSGNTVVAGAPFHNQSHGALYVWVEPSSGWTDMTETAELTTAHSLELGWYVGMSGNTIVGGAPASTVGTNQLVGAAFFYLKPQTGWKTTSNFTGELSPSDGLAGDEFGYSVGISGPTITGGSPMAEVNTNFRQGAAYVFGP